MTPVLKLQSMFAFLLFSFFGSSFFGCTFLSSSVAQASEDQSVPVESITASAKTARVLRGPWSTSFYSFAALDTSVADKKTASVFSYNYISFNRRLGDGQRITFRPTFNYFTEGENAYGDKIAQQVKLEDFHMGYSNYDLYTLGSLKGSGTAKLYLPTSEGSQMEGLLTRTRFETYLDLVQVGRYSSLTYIVKADAYFHKRRTYRNQDIKVNDRGFYPTYPIQTNKYAALQHYLEFDWSLSKKWSIIPAAGFMESWRYDSAVENLESSHTTDFNSSIGCKFAPARAFDIQVVWENSTRLNSRRGGLPIAFYDPNNNSILLHTNIRL